MSVFSHSLQSKDNRFRSWRQGSDLQNGDWNRDSICTRSSTSIISSESYSSKWTGHKIRRSFWPKRLSGWLRSIIRYEIPVSCLILTVFHLSVQHAIDVHYLKTILRLTISSDSHVHASLEIWDVYSRKSGFTSSTSIPLSTYIFTSAAPTISRTHVRHLYQESSKSSAHCLCHYTFRTRSRVKHRHSLTNRDEPWWCSRIMHRHNRLSWRFSGVKTWLVRQINIATPTRAY